MFTVKVLLPQCDLQHCCNPVLLAYNTQIDAANSNGSNVYCTPLERGVFADPRVMAVKGTCGCACLDCCFNAIAAGSDAGCGFSLCGKGSVSFGGNDQVLG